MTVETMQNLSLVAFIAAAVLFLAAVFLFFSLRIRSVIGYLTGSAQKRAVEQIVQRNEKGAVSKARRQVPVRDIAATTVLQDDGPGNTTTVLSDLDNRTDALLNEDDGQFDVEEELIFTESKEVIE